MRILFVTDLQYLPQRTGGSGVTTHALCSAFGAHGHMPGVLAHLVPNGVLGVWNRLQRRIGIPAPSDRVLGYPVYRAWEPLKAAPAIVRAFRPDVAIVKAAADTRIAQLLLDSGLPVILYLHDLEFDKDDFTPPSGQRLLVIANTLTVAERYQARFGLLPRVFYPLIYPKQYEVRSSRQVVTFINPVASKGVEVAFALAERRRDIPFEFVEAWPLEPAQIRELSRRAAALGNVRIRRWTRDIRRVYSRARLLIVPSQIAEAFGRVAAEAQLSGIPVVASNIGGLPEAVGPGGILVTASDIDAWELAVSQLWESEHKYEELSKAALAHSRRAEIQPNFIVSELLRVIEDHVGC